MIILGIDPGTTSIGYAFLKKTKENRNPKLLTADLVFITSKSGAGRLEELHRHLNHLIRKWKPETVSTEKLFFAQNTKTAMEVSEARGTILLTAALAGLNVYEYTPLEMKMALTGDGRADKTQVKKMVRLMMPETANLKAKDDVFDAIALALTCFFKEHNTLKGREK